MEAAHSTAPRSRGLRVNGTADRGRRGQSKNKTWVADGVGPRSGTSTPGGHLGVNGERWERGGHRGSRGRGHGRSSRPPSKSPRPETVALPSHEAEEPQQHEIDEGMSTDAGDHQEGETDEEEPELETAEERERFYQELVKAREVERKRAIAEGKMDDPLVPKRLDEAITMVGTCMDMCPRFERYRRERENNLFEWELIPGTKRVNHKRAVKMYERAAGDKTLPSDLRPPAVLKRTLDYLFHDLLPRAGFSPTFNFIRDRTRAVRNDFTMQHETGALAMECHERCARFHILALHFERERTGFSIPLEEQQLMNTLQSLKEFYEDQRGRYESPNELEMRIYHRLIHIRDQRERHDDIPDWIRTHPVFLLTTKFRQHVQAKSSPITKTSPLLVDNEGMMIFAELAGVLRDQGNRVMVYLVACILERHFGTETIENIEDIRAGLEIPDIIDGAIEHHDVDEGQPLVEGPVHAEAQPPAVQVTAPLQPSATEWLGSNFGSKPTPSAIFGATSTSAFGATSMPAPSAQPPSISVPPAQEAPVVSAFAGLKSTPNVFGTSMFGGSAFGSSTKTTSTSPFGASTSTSAFGGTSSIFESVAKPPATEANVSFATPAPFGQTLPTSESAPAAFTFGGFPTTTAPATPPALFTSQSSSTMFSAASLNPKASPFSPKKLPEGPLESVIPPSPLTPAVAAMPPAAPSPTPSTPSRPILTPITTTPPVSLPTHARPIPFPRPAEPPTTKPEQAPSPFTWPKPSEPAVPPEPAKAGFIMEPISGMPSPVAAPPPVKMQPISLPPTPTATGFQFPIKTTSKSLFGFPSLQSLSGDTGPEVLSPLSLTAPPLSARPSLPSPTTKRPSISLVESPTPAPVPAPAGPSPPQEKIISPVNGIFRKPSKGKERAVEAEDLNEKAAAFVRASLLVKESFRTWNKRSKERVAYKEAVRRSDAYRERVRGERLSGGRKRREVSGPVVEAAPAKRTRRRSSHYVPPRTDEELAARLKENHEQQERRWAPGTFLQAVRTHVEALTATSPTNWRIWVSMNPESDGTAIWVERKFDVPHSGQWASERVFSIPLAPSEGELNSPGLIVFECTPLEGITDDIETKFRVLEDCARLRDIVEALPEDRHFRPSILFIVWGDGDRSTAAEELLQRTKAFIDEGLLKGFSTFSVSSSTTDLDSKFLQVLQTTSLDVVGELVEVLSWEDLLKLAIRPWKEVVSDWISRCLADGEVEWPLYSEVVKASIELLNALLHRLEVRVHSHSTGAVLPAWHLEGPPSSETLFDNAIAWLQKPELQPNGSIGSSDLESHRALDAVFPIYTFIDHIHELAVVAIESRVHADKSVTYSLAKPDLQEMKDDMARIVTKHADKLRRTFAFHVRPKRRALHDETAESSPVPSSKRLKTSTSSQGSDDSALPPVFDEAAPTNGRPTPSPSASPSASVFTVADESPPKVTVAMLRALTRNVLHGKR